MTYLFLLFLLFDLNSFFDEIEKNIILNSDYFSEFIIFEDLSFLGKHFSSDIRMIKKNDKIYLVKQLENDWHYEIEKDYIVTVLCNYLTYKNFIQGIEFSEVFYIPSYVQSSIKKYINKAALVISYHANSSHMSFDESFHLQLKTDVPKRNFDDSEKGLSIKVLNSIGLDPRYLFLVALDTFFCNSDRHNENILSNLNRSIILPIDQGLCYQIPAVGLEIINSIKNNNFNDKYKYIFSDYFKYIKNFNDIFPQKLLITWFIDFIDKYITKEDKEKRIPFFVIKNNIKIHYFFIDYLLKNI